MSAMNPRVESFEEQIARLTAERDAAEKHARGWKKAARALWQDAQGVRHTLRSLRDAARGACDREMGEGHAYPENVKTSTLVAHLNTMRFPHESAARAEQATIRAEHLADRLRSLGQDPDA